MKRPMYYANPPEVILKAGMEIKDELAQALYFFLYLAGSRINEATDFSQNRVSYQDHVRIEMKTLKTKNPAKRYRRVIIPIDINKCHEREMWDIVKGFLTSFDTFDNPFKKWNNMSVYIARNIELECEAKVLCSDGVWRDQKVTKPLHPHYLRHCRASHLVEYYEFTTTELCQFFGWTDSDMAVKYTSGSDVRAAFQRSGK